MSPSRRSFLRLSGVALAGTAGCLGRFGSPSSPGSQASLPDDAPDALRWAYKTTSGVHGSPAVTDDAVYVPNGRLFALDHDGTRRWSVATADAVGSSPAVADAVYFEDAALGDRDDAVRAVEFAGSERWAFEAAESMQLLDLAGGLAYVQARVDGPDVEGYELYVVNTETGEREWTAEIGLPRAFAVRDGSAYVVNDRAVRALATDDGAQRWEWRANVDSSTPRDWTLAGVRNGTVVVAGESSVVALDAADGTERWAATVEAETVTNATLREGAVYVTASDAVSAFDFEDGAHRWRSPEREGEHYDVAGVADGTVYTSGRKGVAAVDADTGEERWTWAHGDDGISTTSAEVYDGLYVTGDSRITAIGTDGEERWRYRMKNADSHLGRPNVSDLGGYVGSGDGTVYAFET